MPDWTDEKLEEIVKELGEKELEKSEEPLERLVVSILRTIFLPKNLKKPETRKEFLGLQKILDFRI